MTIIVGTEMEDFQNILREHAYTNHNFQLSSRVDDRPSSSGELAPLTGHVTVKYLETGVERTYKAGHGTAWVAEFEKDLRGKAFMSFKI